MVPPSRPTLLRDALGALAPVRIRRLFGTEAFFTGERMFAVLGVDALVLRLPEPARTAALQARAARPFLSERLGPAPGRGAGRPRGGGAEGRAQAGAAAVPEGGEAEGVGAAVRRCGGVAGPTGVIPRGS